MYLCVSVLVCMYICVFVYVSVYSCVIYVCTCTCVCVYVCARVCVCVGVGVWECVLEWCGVGHRDVHLFWVRYTKTSAFFVSIDLLMHRPLLPKACQTLCARVLEKRGHPCLACVQDDSMRFCTLYVCPKPSDILYTFT